MEESEVEGLFARLVIERRSKPKLVVNIKIVEISAKGKLVKMYSTMETKYSKNFRVRGVRIAINSTEEFCGRVAVNYKRNGRTFRRSLGVDTKVSYVVACVDATANFRLKIKIEKTGG